MVRVAHHRSGVRDVDEGGAGSERVEERCQRLVQAVHEHFADLGLAVAIRIAEDPHAVRGAFRHEEVAVGRGDNHAGLLQAGDEFTDLEPLRHLRPCALGPFDQPGHLGRRFGGIQAPSKVGDCDPALNAWGVSHPVRHRRRADHASAADSEAGTKARMRQVQRQGRRLAVCL